MPFKFHASRRHHIPRAKYRVMNWPDYDRGLVRRGDIRFWIDESALEGIVKLTNCRLFLAFFHEAKPLKLRRAAIDNLPRFRSESG